MGRVWHGGKCGMAGGEGGVACWGCGMVGVWHGGGGGGCGMVGVWHGGGVAWWGLKVHGGGRMYI